MQELNVACLMNVFEVIRVEFLRDFQFLELGFKGINYPLKETIAMP